MNSKCETCMWMRHSPVGHVCARGFTLEVMLECDCKAYNTPRDSNQLELEERIEDLETQLGWYEEEYDAVLKTHGDTLEEHLERLSVLEEHIKCIMDYINSKETEHTGSNFCGNCIHYHGDCNIPICKLTGEIVDPDDASCAKYKDSFKSYDRLDYEKPDREECRHCDKPECSGCSNYPF